MNNKRHRAPQKRLSDSFSLNRTASALISTLPFLISPAIADSFYWTGAEDSDIRNSNNWSGGSAPEDSDADVIINSPNQAVWKVNDTVGYWYSNSLNIGTDGNQGKLILDLSEGHYGGLYSNSIVVGGNGGTGQLDIDLTQGVTQSFYLRGQTGDHDTIEVGVGQNSVGTINILGQGKTTESYYSEDSVQSEYGTDIRIGADGGTGTVNLIGGGWAATGYVNEQNNPVMVGTGASSTGSVNVLAGGKFATGFMSGGGEETSIIVGHDGGTGSVTVSGYNDAGDARSRATFGNSLILGDGLNSTGSLNVLSGGKALSNALHEDYDAEQKSAVLGVNGGKGDVLVSGEDSIWYASGYSYLGSGDLDNTQIGHLYIGESGEGSVTLSDGGTLLVGKAPVGYIEYDDGQGNITYGYGIVDTEASGNVYLASETGSKGTLTFGGVIGQTPTGAGSLEAAEVVFGDGDGTIAFNHTESNFEFATAISGQGTIANYAGTTWLMLDNSAFSGTTALYGGTLGVTNDHALGSSNINVLGNATLAYADGVNIANAGIIQDGALLNTLVATGDEAEQSGALDGAGSLNKTGGGTLNLTNTNLYTGQTIVSEGTLALVGAGSIEQSSRVVADGIFDVSGTTSTAKIQSLAGSGVVELGTQDLVLTNAADQFDGSLSGSGIFSLDAGMELLTGDSSGFGGQSKVNGGTLAVNGILAGPMDVYSDGTLAGYGQVGATTIHPGGTISPGMPGFDPATLTVNGDLTLSSDATYAVDITPTMIVGSSMPATTQAYAAALRSAQTNDLITVNGAASLNDATVSVTKAGGVYLPGNRWKIVSTTDGINGQFGTLTQDMPFVTLEYDYDANNAYLHILRNDRNFCQSGMSINQCATGNGLDSLGDNSLLAGLVASQVSVEDAARALNLLSGEIHASTKGVMLEDSRFLREAVNNRLIGAAGGVAATDASTPSGFWMHGFGSWGSMDGDSNAASIDRDIGGVFFGGDRQVSEHWRIGALGGYSRSHFTVNDRASSGTSDNYHVGVYAGGQWNKLALRTGLGFSWHEISTDRTVVFPGYADRMKGDYHARTTQLFGELGYQIDTSAVTLEPFANVAYVLLNSDSFNERGDIGALRVTGDDTDLTYTTIGVRGSHKMTLDNGTEMKLWGMAGWRHAFGDITPNSTARFAGGDLFTVTGAPVARNAAAIEVGLETSITRSLSAGAMYSGQFGDGVSDNGLKVYLNWSF